MTVLAALQAPDVDELQLFCPSDHHIPDTATPSWPWSAAGRLPRDPVPLSWLHNPGMTPIELIEVQSGDYLGEDDIVRFDDAYGRSVTMLAQVDAEDGTFHLPVVRSAE